MDIKILLKKKQRHNTNFSEEQKQKELEYRRNYYLTHNKKTIERLPRFFKDPGTIEFFISWIMKCFIFHIIFSIISLLYVIILIFYYNIITLYYYYILLL